MSLSSKEDNTDPRPRSRRRSVRSLRPLLIVAAILLLLLAAELTGHFISRLYRHTREKISDTDFNRDGFIADIDREHIPERGNGQQYIAIHYLGVVGENHSIDADGVGAHFYIYYDGTIYQSADLDSIVWQVGPGSSGYAQIHPTARNANTIGIEMCVKCDGDVNDSKDPTWYFTEETQQAAVRLVRCLMKEMDIPIDHVVRHGDIVDKYCPAPYLTNNHYETSWTWEEFLEAVEDLPEEEVPDYPIRK